LKIILIGPSYPFRGGIANFNDSLYSALEKYHEPHIVSYALQYPSLFFPGKSQFEGDPGQTSHAIPLINSINPFSWKGVASTILEMEPDCVVVHYWMPFFAPALGTILRRLRKKGKIFVIGLLHNVEPHEGIPVGRMLNSYFLRSCDGFITMSSSVYNDLKATSVIRPVRKVSHPVYNIFGDQVDRLIACRKLDLDPERKHLLFFGMIRGYKGLDLLIRVMANPKLSHLNLKLLVAGEFYEDKEKYTGLVDELGLNERIIFTDRFVPQEEVRLYFGAADLVVLPYISATQSGVTQIAYHFDKPMLVTDVGGLREMVAHRKVGYVCSKNPEEIAASVADFFDNNMAPGFVENIKEEKEKFSWEALVAAIEELNNQK